MALQTRQIVAEVMGFEPEDEVVVHSRSNVDRPIKMRILYSSRKLFGGEDRRYELKDTLYCSTRNMRWIRPLRPVVGAHDTAHESP